MMVEATDNSYLLALTLQTLCKFCLKMEQFQYAYGWQNQWAKMVAYVLCCPDSTPEAVSMLSVTMQDGVHPYTISHHNVPLRRGELEFLWCKVDNPQWRFEKARSIIENFKFPKFTVCAPITLLQKFL